jgi:type IV pilus assembly protein PilC
MTFVVMIVIFTFVLPRFQSLYTGQALPGVTRAVLAVSRLFTAHLPALLLGFAGALGLGLLLSRLPGARLLWDRLTLWGPVLGRYRRVIVTARFARTLSSLYASGLPILSALDAAGDALGNAWLRRILPRVSEGVRGGAPLSQALALVPVFDPKLRATVAVGEESGRLDVMLLSVADAFDYDAEQAATRMVTLLEPLCIILMAAVVGVLVVAVMLPVLGMYGALDAEPLPTLGRALLRL